MFSVPSKHIFSSASWSRIGIFSCPHWLCLKELFQNNPDDIVMKTTGWQALSLGPQNLRHFGEPSPSSPGLRDLLASVLMLYRHPRIRTHKTPHLLPVFSAKKKSVVNLWVQLCIKVEMSAYKRTCHRTGAPVTFVKTVTLNNYE